MSAGMKGLAERLRSIFAGYEANGDDPVPDRLVNPDGPEAADRIATLEAALTRQCDNMAFVLNRVDLHGFHTKFSTELDADRAALAAGEGLAPELPE